MPRSGPHLAVLSLLLLLTGSGALESMQVLLTITPFLLLITFLLAGYYPGEGVIEAAIKALARRPQRAGANLLEFPEDTFSFAHLGLINSPEPRGPPSTA